MSQCLVCMQDKEADLIIHGFVDDVMERLLLKLKITL